MSKKVYKWQQDIIDYCANISNEDLLEEVISSAAGDDWDGEFTDQGQWGFNYAKSLLYERLADWLISDIPDVDDTDDIYIMRDGIYDEAPEM